MDEERATMRTAGPGAVVAAYNRSKALAAVNAALRNEPTFETPAFRTEEWTSDAPALFVTFL